MAKLRFRRLDGTIAGEDPQPTERPPVRADDNMKLAAELAAFRALAVEAKEMVDDGTPRQAGLLDVEVGDLHRFIERIAAGAPKEEKP